MWGLSCNSGGNRRLRGDFGRVVRIRELRGDVEPAASRLYRGQGLGFGGLGFEGLGFQVSGFWV